MNRFWIAALGSVVAVAMIAGKYSPYAPSGLDFDRIATWPPQFQVSYLLQIDRPIAVAKFCMPFAAKTIVVQNHSPNVEIQAGILPQVVRSVANVHNGTALNHFGARWKSIGALSLVSIDSFSREPVILTDGKDYYPSDIPGWKIACIFDDNIRMALGQRIGVAEAPRLDTQIGSLEDSRIFRLVADTLGRDDPQADSGSRQYKSENDQGERKYGNRIVRRPLPEGFFGLLVIAAGLGCLVGCGIVGVVVVRNRIQKR